MKWVGITCVLLIVIFFISPHIINKQVHQYLEKKFEFELTAIQIDYSQMGEVEFSGVRGSWKDLAKVSDGNLSFSYSPLRWLFERKLLVELKSDFLKGRILTTKIAELPKGDTVIDELSFRGLIGADGLEDLIELVVVSKKFKIKLGQVTHS